MIATCALSPWMLAVRAASVIVDDRSAIENGHDAGRGQAKTPRRAVAKTGGRNESEAIRNQAEIEAHTDPSAVKPESKADVEIRAVGRHERE